MAEGNDIGGALYCLHAGNDRGVEHRALGASVSAGAQRACYRGRQRQVRLGFGDAMRDCFGSHRDHRRSPCGIQVAEGLFLFSLDHARGAELATDVVHFNARGAVQVYATA